MQTPKGQRSINDGLFTWAKKWFKQKTKKAQWQPTKVWVEWVNEKQQKQAEKTLQHHYAEWGL